MKIVAIIQARLGSTRLPRKVLRSLMNKTVLAHVIDRCKAVPDINQIVVATTVEGQDQLIYDESMKSGVDCFRGDEANVLQRYYQTAKTVRADVIIRVTSDCPLLDPSLIQRLIHHFIRTGADYARIGLDEFPRGLDAEIFTMNVLEYMYQHVDNDFDKEHVTTYIQRHQENFKVEVYREPENSAHYRLTLDTSEDWELIEKIYKELYNDSIFYWNDVKELLISRPELALINANVEQKHNNI